jgi:DNA anti-recombination protein RmuC
MAVLLLLASVSHSGPPPRPSNLAEHYLANLDAIQTPEQRNSAVLKCLAEIASIVDRAASKRAIQVELSGRFKAMLMSVDSRDKDAKTHQDRLFDDLNFLEAKTTNAINETFENVSGSLGDLRRNLVRRMSDALATASESNVSATIQANVAVAVAEHGKTSLRESIAYFTFFQGIIAISVYIIRKYVKNKTLPL